MPACNEKKILLSLSQDEYELLKAKAEIEKMTVTGYLRMAIRKINLKKDIKISSTHKTKLKTVTKVD